MLSPSQRSKGSWPLHTHIPSSTCCHTKNQESYLATQFTICSATGVCKAPQVELVLVAKAMSASILILCNRVLLGAELAEQQAYMVHNYQQQHMFTPE